MRFRGDGGSSAGKHPCPGEAASSWRGGGRRRLPRVPQFSRCVVARSSLAPPCGMCPAILLKRRAVGPGAPGASPGAVGIILPMFFSPHSEFANIYSVDTWGRGASCAFTGWLVSPRPLPMWLLPTGRQSVVHLLSCDCQTFSKVNIQGPRRGQYFSPELQYQTSAFGHCPEHTWRELV